MLIVQFSFILLRKNQLKEFNGPSSLWERNFTYSCFTETWLARFTQYLVGEMIGACVAKRNNGIQVGEEYNVSSFSLSIYSDFPIVSTKSGTFAIV